MWMNEEDIQNLLNLALDASRMGVWSFDIATGQVTWSENVRKLLRAKDFEGSYSSYLALIHPDDRDHVNRVVTMAIHGKHPEYRLVHRLHDHAGDRVRWMEGTGKVFFDEAGRPKRLAGTLSDISDRVRREEAFWKGQERMQLAIKAAGVGYYDWLPQASMPFWDAQMHTIFDVPANFEGNLNDYFMQVLHPEDAAGVMGKMALMLNLESQQFDYHDRYRIVLPQSGEVRHIETWGRVFHGDSGVERLVGMCLDVTEQWQMANALKESEERYRSLVQSMTEGIVLHDANGEILTCNAAAEQILGLSFEQMIGQNPLDARWKVVHEDGSDFPGDTHPAAVTLRTGLPQREVVMGVYRPNGGLAWISVNSEPIFKKSGERLLLNGVVASFTDITQQRQAAEEIRKLALVARHTDNAVVISNPQGHIEWVNEGFHRMTGYTLEEAKGKRPSQLLHGPNTRRETASRIWASLTQGESVHAEQINQRKNGEEFWVEMNIQPIYDSQGRVEEYISIQSDITERKQREQATEAQNEALRKMNQELDNFVYRVSHDLRAPIASVLGLIEVIEQQSDDDLTIQMLGLQRQSLNKMDNFIKDILDYSRNSRMEAVPEPIDLRGLCQGIFDQLCHLDEGNPLQLILELPEHLAFCSDAKRLTMIFNNLISNAFRFKQWYADRPWLRIAASGNGQEVCITVSDNGQGIPEAHIGRIFEMFYRASDKRPGSGLGLYIVKEAVQKLGGGIAVTSVLDQGTEFVLRIPNQAPGATV
jgi:hypothetical protein